jgi:hypothetical protein
MAVVFLSHSSRDKEFVRKLGEDLEKLGLSVWLDQWEIRVGDCIVSKIEQGIGSSDYVIIVLSPHAVQSGWVDREWKAKYWDEINQSRVMVLPVLAEECDIPPLLKTKKYADCRGDNYAVGLVDLMAAISPGFDRNPSAAPLSVPAPKADVGGVLTRLQSQDVPLAQCMAEALEIARAVKNPQLEAFCRNELTGWKDGAVDPLTGERPAYRLVEAFVSANEINMQYVGWGGSAQNVISYMRSEPDEFFPHRMFYTQSVSELEAGKPSYTKKGLFSQLARQKDIMDDPPHPDMPVFVYAAGDSALHVLERIRRELTQRLLALLPPVSAE